MQQRDVLWVGNSNTISIEGLINLLTGEYLNEAQVAVTVLDQSGTPVSGETFPKAAAYKAASNGIYTATLAAELAVVDGQQVTVRVTAQQSNVVGRWEIPMLCLTRANDQL